MIDASQYVGLPFKELGRDRNGIDCYGLLKLCFAETYGIELPTYDSYSSTKDWAQVSPLIQQERDASWEPVTDHREGDVVVLKIHGHPWHCGIVLTYPKFLHVEWGTETCIDRLDSVRWARRVEGFYRHKSMIVVTAA